MMGDFARYVHRLRVHLLRCAGAAVAAVCAAVWLSWGSAAFAVGLVSAEIEANIMRDGSVAVTEVRVFDLAEEFRFVAWDVHRYGATDIEVLGFSGPTGGYTRVDPPGQGVSSSPRTFHVIEEEDRLVVYGWLQPQFGRAEFTFRYRVNDPQGAWGDAASIYRALATPGDDGVHSVRLVFDQAFERPGASSATGRLPSRSWLYTPPDLVERFSIWFGLSVALLALLASAFVIWMYRLRPVRVGGAPISEPPFGLTPGLVGMVLGGGMPGRGELASTIVDFVGRGVVTLQQAPTDGNRPRIWFDRSHVRNLEPDERLLTNLVFDRAGAAYDRGLLAGSSVVSDVRGGLKTAIARVRWGFALTAQLRGRGFAVPLGGSPLALRIAVGALIAAAGLPALVIAGHWWVFAVTGTVAIVVFLTGTVMLRLTEEGLARYARYASFRASLDAASDGYVGRITALPSDEWRRAFVLAVLFGRHEAIDLPPTVESEDAHTLNQMVRAAAYFDIGESCVDSSRNRSPLR